MAASGHPRGGYGRGLRRLNIKPRRAWSLFNTARRA